MKNPVKTFLILLSIFILLKITAPFVIWQENKAEFAFNYIDIVMRNIWSWWTLAMIGIAAALARFLPEKHMPLAIAIGIAVFSILLIEFNFFQGQTALIGAGGEGFNLDTSGSILPALVFGAILAGAIYFRDPVVEFGVPIVLMVTALQSFFALTGSYDSADKSVSTHVQRQAESEVIYQFSDKGNFLFILLDELQTDYFLDIFEKDFNNNKRLLPGFVLYKDHLGLFPMTEYSLLYALTGHVYRNEFPRKQRKKIYKRKGTLIPEMIKAGYNVESFDRVHFEKHPNLKVHPVPIPYQATGKVDISAQIDAESSLIQTIANDRIVPDYIRAFSRYWQQDEVVKPTGKGKGKGKKTVVARQEKTAFFQHLRERLIAHSHFFFDIVRNMTVAAGPPKFKHMHFLTTHNPAGLDRNCKFVKIRTANYTTMRPQTYCTMKTLFDMIAKMKKLGIYEQANIIVYADHGKRLARNGDKFLEQRKFGSIQSPPYYNYVQSEIIASARPLLMVKRAGSVKPLRISNAPTSYRDIPATAREMAGLDPIPGERTVFGVREKEQRKRSFLYYHYHARGKQYQDRLIRFEVNGRSDNPASWTRLHKDYRAPKLNFNLKKIVMGLPKYRHYEYEGWKVDPWKIKRGGNEVFASTAAKAATIELRFSSAKNQMLALTMKSEKSFPDQDVAIDINGKKIGSIRLLKPLGQFRTYKIKIPKSAIDRNLKSLQKLTLRPARILKTWDKKQKTRRIPYGVHLGKVELYR